MLFQDFIEFFFFIERIQMNKRRKKEKAVDLNKTN